MSQTSNPYKNYSGKRRPRKGRKTYRDKRIETIAKRVYEEKEKAETELKLHDVEVDTTVGITGAIHLISNIANGTGYDERVGSVARLKSILFRYSLAAADTSNLVRVILLRWKDNTTPVPGDILEIGPASANIGPLNPIKYNNRDKIQILFDQLHALSVGAVDVGTTYPAPQVEKKYIQKNMTLYWQSDDSIDNGHLYFFFVSDSVAISHPAYHFYSRIRYTDA